MTIQDRPGTRRIRIDTTQLADALAKRVPDADQIDLGKAREVAGEALRDAAVMARESLDRAAGRARDLRGDVAHAGDRIAADNPLDDLGQRIRALASTDAIRAIVARLERDLPDTDRDRYDRAYTRGRVQARSLYLALGIAAGVAAGVAAAALLDPRHGKERRERIAAAAAGLRGRASATFDVARERAMIAAQDRGLAARDVDVTAAPAPSEPSIDAATAGTEALAVTADVPPVTLPADAVPVMVVDPAAIPATDDAATTTS
jgi:hypothetical protein